MHVTGSRMTNPSLPPFSIGPGARSPTVVPAGTDVVAGRVVDPGAPATAPGAGSSLHDTAPAEQTRTIAHATVQRDATATRDRTQRPYPVVRAGWTHRVDGTPVPVHVSALGGDQVDQG
jgi:phage tail sheath protein FI